MRGAAMKANDALIEEVRVRLLRIKNQLEYTNEGMRKRIVRSDGTIWSERTFAGWLRGEPDVSVDHQELLSAVSKAWPREFEDLMCPYQRRCCPFGPPFRER